MSNEGADIAEYDQPGELLIRSPAVVLGYLHNDQANKETFRNDGYMHTGDEAVFKKGPNGTEHIFIVDRIKELIKVKVSYADHPKLPQALILSMLRVCKSHLQSSRPTC